MLKNLSTKKDKKGTSGKISEKKSHKNAFKGDLDFRARLLKTLEFKKEELQRAIARLIENRNGDDASLSADETIEEFDRAAREIETQKRYGIVERKSGELKRIEYLIRRILRDEDFGLCEDCGRRIPEGRLIVMPEATRCVTCQNETERWNFSRKSADGKPSLRPDKYTSDWDETDRQDSAKRFFVGTTGTPVFIEDFEELNGLEENFLNKDKEPQENSLPELRNKKRLTRNDFVNRPH